jgi:ActD protein
MKRARPDLYGILAEFADRDLLLDAARKAHAAGYRSVDAYTPLPVEGLSEAIGFRHTRLPWVVFTGAALGAVGGFGMQLYASAVHYPQNVGGRPLNSWPAYIPITFELTILGASLFAVFGLLALNGLPTPYHPLFNVDRFELASREALFLCVKSKDPKFDRRETRAFLESLAPREVFEVPW